MIWLREKVFKVPEATVGPKALTIIYNIFFPLRFFYEHQSGIHYDPPTDIYTINGNEYTGKVLRLIAQKGIDAKRAGEDLKQITIRMGRESDKATTNAQKLVMGVTLEECKKTCIELGKANPSITDDTIDADDIYDDDGPIATSRNPNRVDD